MSPASQAAYLFKYDSTHGQYKGSVEYDEAKQYLNHEKREYAQYIDGL